MKTIINNTHLAVDVKLATTEVQRIRPGHSIEVEQRPARYRLYGGLWRDLDVAEYKGVSVISFTL